MAVPTSKDELLAAIEKTFAQLSGDLDRVPPAAVRQPVLDGHVKDTMMSPADLIAYLVGWNQQVLTWHRRRAAGLRDEFPAPGIKWNELGLLAQRYYSEHHDDDWDGLRAQLLERPTTFSSETLVCSSIIDAILIALRSTVEPNCKPLAHNRFRASAAI